MCGALSDGAAAMFGPMLSTTSNSYVRSLCSTVQLPHVEARRDDDPDTSSSSQRQNYSSVNVFPDRAALSRALIDFIRCQRWTSVALVYINDDGE